MTFGDTLLFSSGLMYGIGITLFLILTVIITLEELK